MGKTLLKKSVLPSRDQLVTFTTKSQGGPIVSVILSFSDVYLHMLQIKIMVIIFISYINSGFVMS